MPKKRKSPKFPLRQVANVKPKARFPVLSPYAKFVQDARRKSVKLNIIGRAYKAMKLSRTQALRIEVDRLTTQFANRKRRSGQKRLTSVQIKVLAGKNIDRFFS